MTRTFIILICIFCNILNGQEYTTSTESIPVGSSLQKSSFKVFNLDSLTIYNQIDSLITNGIKNKAFPGAQILVAKNDTIVFHEAFGFHTYDSIQPVALDDLYDLASVTKITGPLPAIMKLVG